MASFYELTEDEVEMLLNALSLFTPIQKFWTDEALEAFKELKHYLETRERPAITLTEEPK